jgi:hypothetical protein
MTYESPTEVQDGRRLSPIVRPVWVVNRWGKSIVHPREVYKGAILANAASVTFSKINKKIAGH